MKTEPRELKKQTGQEALVVPFREREGEGEGDQHFSLPTLTPLSFAHY